MSKLLLGNEAMSRTTCLGNAPFVVVVVIVLYCFFVMILTKSGGYCSRIFNAELSYVRQS